MEAGCILSVKYQNIRLQALLSPNTRSVGRTKVPSLVPGIYTYTHLGVTFFFVTFKNNVIYQVKKSLRIGWQSWSLILFQELIFTPSVSIRIFLLLLRCLNAFYKYHVFQQFFFSNYIFSLYMYCRLHTHRCEIYSNKYIEIISCITSYAVSWTEWLSLLSM